MTTRTSPAVLSLDAHFSEAADGTAGVSFCFATRQGHLLYPRDHGNQAWMTEIMKGEVLPAAGRSNQAARHGLKPLPFNFDATKKFKTANVHHSTCIETTKQAIVGLGFEEDSTEETLDDLCTISFQDVMGGVSEDFVQTGNGYMEVVRDGDEVVGLHHLPASDVRIFVENDLFDMHYRIRPQGHADLTHGGRVFARFGDTDDLLRRMGEQLRDVSRMSEVVHFRRPTALSRWYGFPRWIAATASIELVQALHQFNFDFFVNRGVPEFMLFIKGGKVDKDDWEKIQKALQAHIGLGNSHKTFALNLTDPDLEIKVERLNIEGRSDANVFKDMSEVLALNIVSAHGVPPLLAGILIPGKLGATNELPNALQAFQALEVGPCQKTFRTTLACTLGADPGFSLGRDAFALKKITDEFDLGMMDTVSRMRQTVPEAEAEGRDLQAGLRMALEDGSVSAKMGKVLGAFLAAAYQSEE